MFDILPAAIGRTIDTATVFEAWNEGQRLSAISDGAPDRLWRCLDAHCRPDTAARMCGIDGARGDDHLSGREPLLDTGVCDPLALRSRCGLEQHERKSKETCAAGVHGWGCSLCEVTRASVVVSARGNVRRFMRAQ